MQAVVLAGGKGTRLRPLTYALPKPLLPVMGRPLLDHLLARLPKEVDEVLLTVSYMADHLREWAASADAPALAGRSLQVIDEKVPLGTAGAVANCRDRIDGTFIVLNGDLFSDVDLERQIAFHRGRDTSGTIALHEVDDPSRFGVVSQDDAGRILRFVEKPPPEEAPSRQVNAGAYVLEPEVLDRVPPGRAVSIEREVFPQLVAAGALHGFPFEGMWIDCGTPESYLEAHRLLLRRQGVPYLAGPETRFEDAAPRVDETFLASRCRIGSGVVLERTVLHDDVRVDSDVQLVRSIVGAGAHIGAGARLFDAVIGPGEEVPEGAFVDAPPDPQRAAAPRNDP